MANQKTAKNKKGWTKGRVIKWVASIAFALYAIIAIVNMQIQIQESSRKLDAKQLQLEQQKMENQEIARQIEAMDDEGEVERIAREQLDYVSPDEKVFIDISGS